MCFQPLSVNIFLFRHEPNRDAARAVHGLCILAGVLGALRVPYLLLGHLPAAAFRWLPGLPDLSLAGTPAVCAWETVCGPRTCTTRGNLHLAWALPLLVRRGGGRGGGRTGRGRGGERGPGRSRGLRRGLAAGACSGGGLAQRPNPNPRPPPFPPPPQPPPYSTHPLSSRPLARAHPDPSPKPPTPPPSRAPQPPSYYIPSGFVHFLMFFGPALVVPGVWALERKAFVVAMMLTGPVATQAASYWASGGDPSWRLEWAGVWCLFAVVQCLLGVFVETCMGVDHDIMEPGHSGWQRYADLVRAGKLFGGVPGVPPAGKGGKPGAPPPQVQVAAYSRTPDASPPRAAPRGERAARRRAA